MHRVRTRKRPGGRPGAITEGRSRSDDAPEQSTFEACLQVLREKLRQLGPGYGNVASGVRVYLELARAAAARGHPFEHHFEFARRIIDAAVDQAKREASPAPKPIVRRTRPRVIRAARRTRTRTPRPRPIRSRRSPCTTRDGPPGDDPDPDGSSAARSSGGDARCQSEGVVR